MTGAAPDPLSRPVQALLLDVGHTLLVPSQPVEQTYADVANRFGVERSPARIRAAFTEAFRAPGQAGSNEEGRTLRYAGDGRAFWRRVVAHATGSSDDGLFESLYTHYARPDAWHLSPDALPALRRIRGAGIPVALVSNWDTRLRPLLVSLDLTSQVDAVVISAEVGVEKPDPRIFLMACQAVGVPPDRALVVGDDPRADAAGARLAGCMAWTWGRDVADFPTLATRLVQKEPRTPIKGTNGGPTT